MCGILAYFNLCRFTKNTVKKKTHEKSDLEIELDTLNSELAWILTPIPSISLEADIQMERIYYNKEGKPIEKYQKIVELKSRIDEITHELEVKKPLLG